VKTGHAYNSGIFWIVFDLDCSDKVDCAASVQDTIENYCDKCGLLHVAATVIRFLYGIRKEK